MSATNRSGFLALMLVLTALTAPATNAASAPMVQPSNSDESSNSIDSRLRRISEVLRERDLGSAPDVRLAFGFLNGGRVGWGNAPAYGGFDNDQPYYGGGGGFVNGGGFGNYQPGWGNGGFVNGWRGGFRNW